MISYPRNIVLDDQSIDHLAAFHRRLYPEVSLDSRDGIDRYSCHVGPFPIGFFLGFCLFLGPVMRLISLADRVKHNPASVSRPVTVSPTVVGRRLSGDAEGLGSLR